MLVYMICKDFNDGFIYRIITCKIVRLQKFMRQIPKVNQKSNIKEK